MGSWVLGLRKRKVLSQLQMLLPPLDACLVHACFLVGICIILKCKLAELLCKEPLSDAPCAILLSTRQGQCHAQVSWQRVRVANALADSGEEWVGMLDTLNSGTYNNQYMVRPSSCMPLLC